MAHPYSTRETLNTLLGDVLVVKLLDLNKDGNEDAGVYDAVREEADREIDSCLAKYFAVPFGRASDDTAPDQIKTLSDQVTAGFLLAKRHKSAEEVKFYLDRANETIKQLIAGTKELLYADTGETAERTDADDRPAGFKKASTDPKFGGVDSAGVQRMSKW